jgi:MFS family permease
VSSLNTDLTLEPSLAAEEWRAGWRIVLASLCGIASGVTGLFFYSAGIFLKPVAGEFGWSRAAASTVPLAAALALGFAAPLVGNIVDRCDSRSPGVVSSIGLALGFWLLSYAPPSLAIYLALVVIAALLGAGASPVAYTRLINQHFVSARGTALGIAQTATGIAGAVIPAFLIPFVAHHGWRAGYRALAVCAFASLPVVLLLLWKLPKSRENKVSPGSSPGFTLSQVLHRVDFFTMALMLALAATGVGGVIVHLVPMLSDAGLLPGRAGTITSVLGVGIIIGRILTGILVDRVFAPRVACSAFALAAGGCWLLAQGGIRWATPATALVGLAMGAEIDLISYLVARYYGLSAYGRIYGVLYAVFMVGTSIGPVLAGATFDHFGNYRVAEILLGTCLALAALVSLALPRFRPEPASS